jgi:predicted negative regulator of RcsB-dependent stress response
MESKVVDLPITDRLWAWFEINKKPVMGTAAVVTAVGLVVWFFVWRSQEKQAAAGIALSNVTAGLQTATGAPANNPEPYLKVASQYAGSAGGARALLQAASAYYADGKYTEAQAQFERFLREYKGSPLMAQASMGLAACLDAQGKTEPATKAYNDLILRHPTENFIPQAKFSLARLYENQGNVERARDLYLEIEQSSRFTALGNEAGMRVEELIAKHPKLAPPTAQASSTNAAAPAAAVRALTNTASAPTGATNANTK